MDKLDIIVIIDIFILISMFILDIYKNYKSDKFLQDYEVKEDLYSNINSDRLELDDFEDNTEYYKNIAEKISKYSIREYNKYIDKINQPTISNIILYTTGLATGSLLTCLILIIIG